MGKQGKWAIGLLAIAGIGSTLAMSAAKRGNKAAEVRMEGVQKRDLVASVTASGQVRPQTKVDIAADVSGLRRRSGSGSKRDLRAASASTLRIASSSGEPLARDVGLVERRHHAAQLRHQRGARALVERTAGLAGALVETGDRLGDQGIVVGHQVPLFRDCRTVTAARFVSRYALSGFERIAHQNRVLPLRARR